MKMLYLSVLAALTSKTRKGEHVFHPAFTEHSNGCGFCGSGCVFGGGARGDVLLNDYKCKGKMETHSI